jgi:multisubunit Na+/H+ antiporter MnhB subunit
MERRRWGLAFSLVALLAVVIIAHYTCTIVLEWNGKKVDGITQAFNAILPVVSGLVGSAVTYYFTRGSSDGKI